MESKEKQYGVEIVKDKAYVSGLGYLTQYHPAYRDNDFVGTIEEVKEYLKKFDIKEIFGLN